MGAAALVPRTTMAEEEECTTAQEDKVNLLSGVVGTERAAGITGESAPASGAKPRKTLPVSKKEMVEAWIEGFGNIWYNEWLRQKVRNGITFHDDGGGVTLNLGYARIMSIGATQVARALEADTTLTKLNLWYNDIRAEDAAQVDRALEANTTLTQVNLSYNGVGNEGATRLARALEVNTTPTPANLSYNGVGNEGATRLARALEVNTTLTQLNLGNSRIGAEGATQVARALEANTTLMQLDLGGG